MFIKKSKAVLILAILFLLVSLFAYKYYKNISLSWVYNKSKPTSLLSEDDSKFIKVADGKRVSIKGKGFIRDVEAHFVPDFPTGLIPDTIFSPHSIGIIDTVGIHIVPRIDSNIECVDRLLSNNQLKNTMSFEWKFEKNDPKDFVYISVHHNAHARSSLKMFYDSPVVGHGPNMFRFVCHKFLYNEFSCTTHPHNFYLQLLSETGTFGFLFLLIFLIQVIIKIFSGLLKPIYSKKNNIKFLLYLSILISIMPFFPSGNLFNNWLAPQIFLPFGFLIYLNNRKNL